MMQVQDVNSHSTVSKFGAPSAIELFFEMILFIVPLSKLIAIVRLVYTSDFKVESVKEPFAILAGE
jgi:hypothetical protein